jgi:hypothetical protein
MTHENMGGHYKSNTRDCGVIVLATIGLFVSYKIRGA